MGYSNEYYPRNSKRVCQIANAIFPLKFVFYVFFTPSPYNSMRIFFSLAYLHEGLEPKVVHRDVKSSNILLDRQWNSKVSDFGLAKLLCSERSYVTTRVMGTFGLVDFLV